MDLIATTNVVHKSIRTDLSQKHVVDPLSMIDDPIRYYRPVPYPANIRSQDRPNRLKVIL
jgi:hypothetical protein